MQNALLVIIVPIEIAILRYSPCSKFQTNTFCDTRVFHATGQAVVISFVASTNNHIPLIVRCFVNGTYGTFIAFYGV